MSDEDDDDLAPVIVLPVRRHPDDTSRDNRDADDLAAMGGAETPGWQAEATACRHPGPVVDDKARTVTCSKCGVPLDPIDALAKIARLHERVVSTRRMIERDTDSKIKDLRVLEREERNAKSRLRTARKRAILLDREAIEAAAQSVESIGGYRSWDQLNDEQRKVVLCKTERIIEAYAGELDSLPVVAVDAAAQLKGGGSE